MRRIDCTDCDDCGVHLPLREPQATEAVHDWYCVVCGTRNKGVVDQDAREAIRFNIAPVRTACAVAYV